MLYWRKRLYCKREYKDKSPGVCIDYTTSYEIIAVACVHCITSAPTMAKIVPKIVQDAVFITPALVEVAVVVAALPVPDATEPVAEAPAGVVDGVGANAPGKDCVRDLN